MSLPTKNQILEALAKTETLVPAPRTLGRALQLLRNPDSGLSDIVELINRDSALAADVLRCANSAFYGRNTRTAAVGEAVQVIGFHETIRLVSLVAIHSTTSRDLGSYGIAADEFWSESLFNGLFFDALAKHTNNVDSGEAYTAGLLRFIGRLALNQALQDLGGGLFWDGQQPLVQWERENVGLTQADVGANLLRRWQFPDPIVTAVESQDLPPEDAIEIPQALVQAMNLVARVLPAGAGVPVLDAKPLQLPPDLAEHPFALAYGFDTAALVAIHAEATQAYVAIRETLYR